MSIELAVIVFISSSLVGGYLGYSVRTRYLSQRLSGVEYELAHLQEMLVKEQRKRAALISREGKDFEQVILQKVLSGQTGSQPDVQKRQPWWSRFSGAKQWHSSGASGNSSGEQSVHQSVEQ